MADDLSAMKIVFLLQDTGGVYGAERATLELARGLAASGISIHILLIAETRLGLQNSPLQDAFTAAGLPRSAVETAKRFSLKLARDIANEIRRVGGTILHSTGYKADLHGVLAARRANIPQVSTVHGWLFRPDPKELFYAWLNIRAFKRCERVIALTNHYEQLLRRAGVPRVERISTGLPVEQPSGKTARPFTFGILGRLSWEKNHALFLAAAAELQKRNMAAAFVISGDGPLSGEIESQVSQLKLLVEMTGYIPSAEFFARVDALVICSRVENLPLVVMEAMARGVPVIATNVGGLPDLVENGVCGLLVPSDDVTALAGAMEQFARTPSLATRLGKAGREKLQRDFDPARWIARHVELYRSL